MIAVQFSQANWDKDLSVIEIKLIVIEIDNHISNFLFSCIDDQFFNLSYFLSAGIFYIPATNIRLALYDFEV